MSYYKLKAVLPTLPLFFGIWNKRLSSLIIHMSAIYSNLNTFAKNFLWINVEQIIPSKINGIILENPTIFNNCCIHETLSTLVYYLSSLQTLFLALSKVHLKNCSKKGHEGEKVLPVKRIIKYSPLSSFYLFLAKK